MRKNGSVKSSSASGNLTLPFDASPINLSVAGNSGHQKIQEFCKAGASSNFSSSNILTRASTVVVDALRSFNDCVALKGKGLNITHSEQFPESVIFYGEFVNRTSTVTLDIVDYDADKVTCTSSNFSWLGTREKVSGDQKKIPSNFNITCRRIPINLPGSFKYPRATVAISTSLGPYNVVLQEDDLQGFALASEAKKETDRLSKIVEDLQMETGNLKAAAARADSYSVILYHGNNLGFNGQIFSRSAKLFKTVGCPKNDAQFQPGVKNACIPGYEAQYVGLLWDYSGGTCGNTFHELKCVRR